MKRYSIIHEMDSCFLCGTTQNTHIHEVFFGTANRKLSIEFGLCVCLCAEHHTGKAGVHHNKPLDNALKSIAQQKAMKYYNWTVEDFIRIFGKNYIKE